MKNTPNNNVVTNSWTINNWNVALQLMQHKIDYLTTDRSEENVSKL
jgi:hypothetical protein